MELSDAWTPEVTQREVEEEGVLLDEKYDPCPDMDIQHKVLCKLYYLKSKDLFVTISDGMTDAYSAIPLHIISSQFIIETLKYKYLKQERRAPSKDAFMEYDETEYAGFQSELNLNDIESIKKYGRFLERIVNSSSDVYYLEHFDKFVVFEVDINRGYVMDDPQYRKKFNIPYQDERFN